MIKRDLKDFYKGIIDSYKQSIQWNYSWLQQHPLDMQTRLKLDLLLKKYVYYVKLYYKGE